MIDTPAPTADDSHAPATAWAPKIAKLPPARFMGRDCADLAEKYRQVRGIALALPGERAEAASETTAAVETDPAGCVEVTGSEQQSETGESPRIAGLPAAQTA